MADHPSPQRVHGYCGLCIARCGTVAVVEDGRFTRLEPDPAHPTGQALCAKGRSAPELVYHPERLTHPLRRTRPKGDPDPGWESIGWDEALDLMAGAMSRVAERHGPQALAFAVSSPSTITIGGFHWLHPTADKRLRDLFIARECGSGLAQLRQMPNRFRPRGRAPDPST